MTEILVPRLPRGLYGRLISPRAGDIVAPGPLVVSGWTASLHASPASIRARIGETELGATSALHARAGGSGMICQARLRDKAIAWSLAIDLGDLYPGRQRLDIEVKLNGDDWHLLDSVIILVGAVETFNPLGRITAPKDGAQVRPGRLAVTGYALHRDGPVRAVVVNLNGAPLARADVTESSPEAAERWPDLAWAADAGWRAEISLQPRSGHNLDLSVEALMPNDEWALLDNLRIDLLD